MSAYYIEFDPFAAEWLRALIAAGHIAPGVVDTRSIVDVRPEELAGFTQCHFFAGIGVWSQALRSAGWSDERPVWTGSCPCQPFSAAGKGGGFDDERHLWPHFHWLIEQCRPPIVLGEQVASKDGLAWIDLVQADLEGSGYTSGALDTCAAGFGAPHIRQRLYWTAYPDNTGLEGRIGAEERSSERAIGPNGLGSGMAYTSGERRNREQVRLLAGQTRQASFEDVRGSRSSRVAHTIAAKRPFGESGERTEHAETGRLEGATETSGLCGIEWVADAAGSGRREECSVMGGCPVGDCAQRVASGFVANGSDLRSGQTNGHWRDADWLFCRGGKWRPVESGTFPLAHGSPARVGRLRGYGNAIVAPQAAAFIEAVREVIDAAQPVGTDLAELLS
jgi:DNA (cytosine-5)-methyltransferase 1